MWPFRRTERAIELTAREALVDEARRKRLELEEAIEEAETARRERMSALITNPAKRTEP